MAALAAERSLVAQGCRVLAARGVSDGFLGHISLRVDAERLLVRCRGERERGLAWTEPSDVRLVRFDGTAGASGELDGFAVPNELPIHAETLRARPDAAAVVHAHPEAVVCADLAGLKIEPILGAYDIPGARLAAAGVPVYPRGVLIRTAALGAEMVAALAGHGAVVLRGHGVTAVGGSVQEAVLRAVAVNTIARVSLTVAAAGGSPRPLPESELALLPDLGPAFNEGVAWRHECARLGEA